jgi:phage-related protein
MAWVVRYYQPSRGNCPIVEFIESLDTTTSAKIIHSIELLESYGPFLKPPYIKKIQNKLYEIRIPGKVAVRIFYTVINQQYFLLHAFVKKSQKTPYREIKTAIDRMNKII